MAVSRQKQSRTISPQINTATTARLTRDGAARCAQGNRCNSILNFKTINSSQTPSSLLRSQNGLGTYLGHVFAPERAPRVREVTIDDVPCVHVELSGRHGQRKEMLLYACDYSEIKNS